jgi:peptide/nickel transport system substrate-binding protein
VNRITHRRGVGRAFAMGAAALAASTLVLAGCAAGTDPDDSAAGTDELRVAVTAYPGSWDQDFVAFDLVALSMFKNVYPYLIDYGITEVDGGQIFDTENIIPTWAESFTSEDGQNWTLVIKEGAVFPSGNPMTAEDVKWSKDRAFAASANVAGIYRLIGLTDPDQVVVVDDRTVEFRQEWPSALSEQIQAISLFVYDSVLLKEHATADDPWAQDWVAQNPADGGYFVVSSATPGQEIVLTANPDYLGENPAAIETVTFTVVSDTASAAVLLRQGDVDVALGLSATEIADLADAEGVEVISAPSNQMVYLPMNTASGPLADPLVRQAIASAIPYDQIISTVYAGEARRPSSLVPIDMPGYSTAGFPFDQDLAAAKDLLAQAGVGEFGFELAYPASDGASEQIAILIQAALGDLGITVTPLPLDPATLGERRAAKDLDMQIASGQQWVNDVEYLANNTLVTDAYLNYSGYSNPIVDEAVAQARTITDPAERIALWESIQEQLAVDVPAIPLAQPNFLLPVRDNVSGFVMPVDGLIRFNTFTIE